jgi:hypothetical protein
MDGLVEGVGIDEGLVGEVMRLEIAPDVSIRSEPPAATIGSRS